MCTHITSKINAQGTDIISEKNVQGTDITHVTTFLIHKTSFEYMYTQGMYRDRHTEPVKEKDTISELKMPSDIFKFYSSEIIK